MFINMFQNINHSFSRLLLDKFSISAFGMGEVEKYGIDKVIEMALDKVDPKGERSLHVSFDIDALDTLEAPSTGVPGKLISKPGKSKAG